MSKNREVQCRIDRAYRARLIARGVCPRCKRRRDRADRYYCTDCRKKAAAKRMADLTEE